MPTTGLVRRQIKLSLSLSPSFPGSDRLELSAGTLKIGLFSDSATHFVFNIRKERLHKLIRTSWANQFSLLKSLSNTSPGQGILGCSAVCFSQVRFACITPPVVSLETGRILCSQHRAAGSFQELLNGGMAAKAASLRKGYIKHRSFILRIDSNVIRVLVKKCIPANQHYHCWSASLDQQTITTFKFIQLRLIRLAEFLKLGQNKLVTTGMSQFKTELVLIGGNSGLDLMRSDTFKAIGPVAPKTSLFC